MRGTVTKLYLILVSQNLDAGFGRGGEIKFPLTSRVTKMLQIPYDISFIPQL